MRDTYRDTAEAAEDIYQVVVETLDRELDAYDIQGYDRTVLELLVIERLTRRESA